MGVIISLGDMELALDYMNDSEVFKPEIEEILESKISKSNFNEKLLNPTKEIPSFSNVSVEEDYTDDSNIFDEIELGVTNFFSADEIEELEEQDLGDENTEDLEGDSEEDYSDYFEDDYFSEEDELESIENLGVKNEDGEETEEEDSYFEDTIVESSIKTREKESFNTVEKIIDTKSDRESELEKRIEELTRKLNESNQKNESTGDKKEIVTEEKVTQIDKANNNEKIQNKIKNNDRAVIQEVEKQNNNGVRDRINYYNELEIGALYSEVKKFMSKNNVKQTTIDRTILETEFGQKNIKKLLLKSYLISIGRGVTIGR